MKVTRIQLHVNFPKDPVILSEIKTGRTGNGDLSARDLLTGAEAAGQAVGPNQHPSPPIPSPRAGRGERTCKSCFLQPLLRLITYGLILYRKKIFSARRNV